MLGATLFPANCLDVSNGGDVVFSRAQCSHIVAVARSKGTLTHGRMNVDGNALPFRLVPAQHLLLGLSVFLPLLWGDPLSICLESTAAVQSTPYMSAPFKEEVKGVTTCKIGSLSVPMAGGFIKIPHHSASRTVILIALAPTSMGRTAHPLQDYHGANGLPR